MKILVLGAAGRTGAEVVRQAVAEDHLVTVLVHTTKGYEDPGSTIVFEGDATDPATLDRCLPHQDAVLDCIGGHAPFLHTDLERTVARALIPAMQRHSVRRLVVLSMLGEGDSKANAPWAYEHLLLPTYLHGAAPDKAAMEQAVASSPLDWTILRPAILTDEPATGMVKVFLPATGETARFLTRADLAATMLAELTTPTHLHQTVTIANSD